MTNVRHILVPTDGSDGALKAAAFAGDLARPLGARVSVLMVQDERSVVAEAWNAVADPSAEEGAVASVRQSMEKSAYEQELATTKSAVGEISGEIDVTQTWGHPAMAICEFAEKHSVDLIVMGSHGRGALKRAILGSVSHAVVNSAHCAVTIVR